MAHSECSVNVCEMNELKAGGAGGEQRGRQQLPHLLSLSVDVLTCPPAHTYTIVASEGLMTALCG
jgi:hypothetical protein